MRRSSSALFVCERQFSSIDDEEATVFNGVGLAASRHRALILNDDLAGFTALDAHTVH